MNKETRLLSLLQHLPWVSLSILGLIRSWLTSSATSEVITLNDPHAPHQNAIDAFNHALHTIKAEIVKSRHHWDKHEPKMWSRAAGLSDHELTSFKIEEDLVLVNGLYDTCL